MERTLKCSVPKSGSPSMECFLSTSRSSRSVRLEECCSQSKSMPELFLWPSCAQSHAEPNSTVSPYLTKPLSSFFQGHCQVSRVGQGMEHSVAERKIRDAPSARKRFLGQARDLAVGPERGLLGQG